MSLTSDLATALEFPLSVENEAKFVALKNLQLKKIKQLMASLDLKDKEIAKLKILGKDNRRTQMIQALRNKIRDLELINDVVKEELGRKGEMDTDEVNQLIIRKTLGGPKRFRPLTREELENKIIELEKKINKKSLTSSTNNDSNEAKEGSANPMSQSKAMKLSNDDFKATNATTPSATTPVQQTNGLVDTALLIDELHKLKSLLNARESLINSQKDEIVRLRARNAELTAIEEDIDFFERQSHDLNAYNETLLKKLEENTGKLADITEENIRLKSKADNSVDQEQTEFLSLQQQCEKLLNQNITLMKSLNSAEELLRNYEEENSKSKQKSYSAETLNQSKDQKIKSLEDKLLKFEEKFKQLETHCQSLESKASQVEDLKNQLRDKNIAIKEMKRNIEERDKAALMRQNTASRIDGPKESLKPATVIPTADEKEREAKDITGSK